MEKSNEIALQLTNNTPNEITVSLFTNVNNSNFVQSQTEEFVPGQLYDIGNTDYGLDEAIQIMQTNKQTGETIALTIPYVGSEGPSVFIPDDFITFCNVWFPANGYGTIYGTNAPDMIIYSDLYEYGNLIVPEA